MNLNPALLSKTIITKREFYGGLLVKLAISEIGMIVLDVLGPVRPVLCHCQLQPRLHIPVIMYHSRVLKLGPINARIVAQAQYMP